MDHRKCKDTSRRWTILDIIWTSQEDEWSLRAKRMDTSTLFFLLQVNRRLQSWDTGTNIYRSSSRSITTSNWWNSELKPTDGESDYHWLGVEASIIQEFLKPKMRHRRTKRRTNYMGQMSSMTIVLRDNCPSWRLSFVTSVFPLYYVVVLSTNLHPTAQ